MIATVSLSRNPQERLQGVLDKFDEVFSEGLGTIEPFRAKLMVSKDASPKFYKPRSVPFAIRDAVAGDP